jgi:hypothetical protein
MLAWDCDRLLEELVGRHTRSMPFFRSSVVNGDAFQHVGCFNHVLEPAVAQTLALTDPMMRLMRNRHRKLRRREHPCMMHPRERNRALDKFGNR